MKNSLGVKWKQKTGTRDVPVFCYVCLVPGSPDKRKCSIGFAKRLEDIVAVSVSVFAVEIHSPGLCSFSVAGYCNVVIDGNKEHRMLGVFFIDALVRKHHNFIGITAPGEGVHFLTIPCIRTLNGKFCYSGFS